MSDANDNRFYREPNPMTGPQPTASAEVEALATAHCSTCGHQVRHHEPYPYLDGVVCKTKRKGEWCDCPLNRYEALLTSDWLAAYVQAARDEERARVLVEVQQRIRQESATEIADPLDAAWTQGMDDARAIVWRMGPREARGGAPIIGGGAHMESGSDDDLDLR